MEIMPRHIQLTVGSFEGESTHNQDKGYLDKAVMLVYAGKFESMDGPVEIKDEDIDKLVMNHNSFMSKLSRLATGDLPLKHSPPIQLDHSTSARDTVGRLVGDLKVGEHTTEDGSKVKAMMGTARILGADNIERVNDGRWTHVSMGADLESHKLTELTITPFPAAGDASLLSKRRLNHIKEGVTYKGCLIDVYQSEAGEWFWQAMDQSGSEKSKDEATAAAKKCIDEFEKSHPDKLKAASKNEEVRLGYKDMKEKMAAYEKCRKHLSEVEKKSDEDAEKHLEGMTDDDLTAMGAAYDAHCSKLAEEADKAKEEESKHFAKMKGAKDQFVALSKGFKSTAATIQLASKKSSISVRLSKLRSDAKITPAEIKAINLDEFAGKDDKVIDEVLSSYEKREPVIDVGLIGSTKAVTPAQLAAYAEKHKLTKTELETRLNMPMKRDEALKQLAKLAEEGDGREVEVHIDNVPQGSHTDQEFEKLWGDVKSLMDGGKHDDAKEHLRKHLAGYGPRMGEAVTVDPTPQMSALADEVKKMQTSFEEIVKLAAPALGIKTEELA